MTHPTRRTFLAAGAATTALSGLGDFSFLTRLRRVSAAESKVDPRIVQFQPEIEPLVRLLEETPRDRVIEKVAARIQAGASYQEVLASLLLAGVRNVQPRPSVGFKFHAVLVVNSAHLASMASPDSDRWLPILWAIDEFKSSQARDVREGNWTMEAVDESAVPPAHRAKQAFIDAMDRWDVEAADAAVAGLARSAGANEIFELFARYGVRDFRSIGHKAIYVANSWRTLQCIGWHHAEPVLRSLAYALLNHHGEPNPAQSDLAPDRPGRRNKELAAKIRGDWQTGKLDNDVTSELLKTLYDGAEDDACDKTVELINRGASPQSVYDALLVGAGELLMRQPGIIGLHAVTSTNALRYIYQTASDEQTRRMALLQNAAFLPLFRQRMPGRGSMGDQKVVEMEPGKLAENEGEILQDIFHDVGADRSQAARKVLAYLKQGRSPEDYIDAARRLVFLKGNDSHDYKFSSAVLEDYYHVSPAWRDSFMATSVFNLQGSTQRDNGLVQRIREALA